MKQHITIFGFYCALVAFVAIVAYGAVQILQVLGVLHYPLDDRLIYGCSLAIAPAFLLAILAFHELSPVERRFWPHAAVLFAVLYAGYVILMYSVQLATVIPTSLVNRQETVLTVKPHSFFWTLDALGYICMGISTFFAGLGMPRKGSRNLWLRRFLLANGFILPLICFAYFYPQFTTMTLLIGSPWLVTASGSMLLLAVYFYKVRRLKS
ncbi:hypothetical protein [Mucilaginibacter aquariorum]|uniref:DUF998 domain-containing protein n=1 Tax=Mucilaginibacter aquariorum TaxID=2967225 RepID=A0ABT1T2D1_9SPHI|nr:hypothetical protein [Mucilaginibacter aquariorum]MCQ6958765.1 hypothetical protein [Mucilaginibacter aquariorum]